jgi:hypothetical protein
MDIYTYFTAEQTRALLVSSKNGVRPMINYLKTNFGNDFQALVYAIADCMPQLVAEDRVYKAGPRKGQRKLMFRNIDTDISSIIAQELTGCATTMEFIKVYSHSKPTMYESVINDPDCGIQYKKHWIKSFLDDIQLDFSNVKQHYRDMTVEPMRLAQAAVDTWLANNPHDIDEIMTWNGAKYNEWHFANMKKAA